MAGKAPKAPKDANADIRNRNKGTPGTNRIYDQAQGNRSKQIQQSREKKK
ncbi:hypothetical protein M2D07_014285 [Pseudomonas sp. BGr12]|nr:hypothetical protein [Pseudomonas sp. BJa5]MDL2428183.1 hypothetical protein [Pseudomonas sp. BJa5]